MSVALFGMVTGPQTWTQDHDDYDCNDNDNDSGKDNMVTEIMRTLIND